MYGKNLESLSRNINKPKQEHEGGKKSLLLKKIFKKKMGRNELVRVHRYNYNMLE